MFSFKNKIQKVIFEVDYFDYDTAQAMQNKLIADFQLNIEGMLDRVLAKYTTEYIISKNTLELDLGVISIEEFNSAVPAMIEKTLSKYLSDLRYKIEGNQVPLNTEIILINNRVQLFLLNYLKYGSVAWDFQQLNENQSFEYWISYLHDVDRSLFEELLALLNSGEARTRFLQILPVHKNDSLLRNYLGEQYYAFLKDASLLYSEIESICLSVDIRLPDRFDSGHFILYLRWGIYKEKQTKPDIYFLTKSLITFLESISTSLSRRLIVHLLLMDSGNISPMAGVFQNVLSDVYFEKVKGSPDADFWRAGKTVKAKLTIDEWSGIHYKNWPHEVVLILQKLKILFKSFFYDKTDSELEGFIMEGVMQPISHIDSIEDMELWAYSLLSNLAKDFGPEIQGQGSEIIRQVFSKEKWAEDFVKSKSISLPAIEVSDLGRSINLTINEVIKQLSLIGTSGLHILGAFYTDPYSVVLEMLGKLGSDHPHYYSVILKNLSKDISQLEILELVTSGASEKLIKHLCEASGKDYLRYGKIADTKELGRALLIEIMHTGQIPTYIIQKFGLNKISDSIRDFSENYYDELKQLGIRYGFKLTQRDQVYLSRLIGSKYVIPILKSLSADKIKEPEGDLGEIINLSKFQFAITLYLDSLLKEKDYSDLAEIISALIDARNKEFARFVLSMPEEKLAGIKELLPLKYKKKIDNLLQSFTDKFKPVTEGGETKKDFFLTGEGEPLYIKNAGLVILSTFLTRLFNNLKLLKDKKFISFNEQVKAVKLLNYLTTGLRTVEEPETLLNKILVGMDPEQPLSDLSEISDEEAEMCDSLLNAAIKHWGVLKSTSIDSMRGGFIIRNGRLTFQESDWHLKVERKAIDVLIDKLPWGFSMIKLPWMEYTINTEW